MIRHSYQTKVYYRDIDQMGVVYYSRYLEYFEAARTELLDYIGLDIRSIEKLGVWLPVIRVECDYQKGPRLEDRLLIETSIAEMPKFRMKIHYEVYIESNPDLVASGSTEHVFMSRITGKPVRPPKKITENFITHF